MFRKKALLCSGLLFLASCGSRIVFPPLEPPTNSGPVVPFELDPSTKTITVVSSTDASAATQTGVAQQMIQQFPSSFQISGTVKNQIGDVYEVQFTVKNTASTDLGVDGEITATLMDFQALDGQQKPVLGGGIMNPSGHHAEFFDPYIALSNGSRLEGNNPLPIEPGTTFQFSVQVQVPAEANRARFGLVLRAEREYGALPFAPHAWLTPAFGKYNYQAFQEGTADQTRFSTLVSMTHCPGDPAMYVIDTSGLWKLQGQTSKLLKSAPEYTVGANLVCNQDGLFMSSYTTSKIYRILPDHTLQTIAGTGDIGIQDGPGTSATLSNPFSLTAYGTTLYFVDATSKRIRKATKDKNGAYNVMTVYISPSEELSGVALDAQANLYFTSLSGLYRWATNAPAPVPIFGGAYLQTKLWWHPSGHLLMPSFFENRLYAFAPGDADPSKPWKQIVLAGNGEVAAPKRFVKATEGALSRPYALSFTSTGNIFIGSYSQHLIYQVEVLD